MFRVFRFEVSRFRAFRFEVCIFIGFGSTGLRVSKRGSGDPWCVGLGRIGGLRDSKTGLLSGDFLEAAIIRKPHFFII